MNTNNNTKVERKNGEQGQVLLAVIIILAIIVIGMLIVMDGMGIKVPTSVPANCYEYLNAAGDVVQVVCNPK